MTQMTPEQALRMLADKQSAYRQTFGTPHGKAVLDDLKPFCRVRESCVVLGDRDATYVLEGRREVFLRVQDFLERTPEELLPLYFKLKGATDAA